MRAGQTGRCRRCGNRVDRYERFDGGLIALHPAEVVTTDIPTICRLHVSSGIAYPYDDGSGWCRIAHGVLCPQRPPHCQTDSPTLVSLRRELRIRTRRLIDTGAFTPQTTSNVAVANNASERQSPRSTPDSCPGLPSSAPGCYCTWPST